MDVISKGTQRGMFCFRKDGVGHIDENIRQVPINFDCDPRITCQLSIWDGCKNELTGIEVSPARSLEVIRDTWSVHVHIT